jgi:hypothetical protein
VFGRRYAVGALEAVPRRISAGHGDDGPLLQPIGHPTITRWPNRHLALGSCPEGASGARSFGSRSKSPNAVAPGGSERLAARAGPMMGVIASRLGHAAAALNSEQQGTPTLSLVGFNSTHGVPDVASKNFGAFISGGNHLEFRRVGAGRRGRHRRWSERREWRCWGERRRWCCEGKRHARNHR